MEVVIFDIEASCDDKEINPHYNMETIEIGAVKVKNGEIIDEFQTFIKPEYVNELTPFCTKLTGITYADLEDAPSFNEAIVKFYSFIYGLPIYSCGEFDRKFLVRELKEKGSSYSHKMTESAISSSHKNLKIHFDKVTGNGMRGMIKMARVLNVDITGTHHRALDDSRNLTKIYLKLESIRKDRLSKIFNGDKLAKLVESINEHHNRSYEVINDGHIKNDRDLGELKLLDFLDIWKDAMVIDYHERDLRYLNDEDLTSIKRFARY